MSYLPHPYPLPELTAAATAGDLPQVRALLEKGADLHEYEDYPLRQAIHKGHYAIVKYLFSKGANPHVGGRSFLLKLAVMSYEPYSSAPELYLLLHRLLLKKGCEVCDEGFSGLRWAVKSCSPRIMKAFLKLREKGLNMAAEFDMGGILDEDFTDEDLPCYRMLLEEHRLLREQGQGKALGEWELRRACGGSSVKIVRVLLESGLELEKSEPGFLFDLIDEENLPLLELILQYKSQLKLNLGPYFEHAVACRSKDALKLLFRSDPTQPRDELLRLACEEVEDLKRETKQATRVEKGENGLGEQKQADQEVSPTLILREIIAYLLKIPEQNPPWQTIWIRSFESSSPEELRALKLFGLEVDFNHFRWACGEGKLAIVEYLLLLGLGTQEILVQELANPHLPKEVRSLLGESLS